MSENEYLRPTYYETFTFTVSAITSADHLAMFVLNKATSGNGTIVIKTHSLHLNLEKNSIQNLCNTSVMLGDGSGFELPSAKIMFPHLPPHVVRDRVVSV